MGHDRLALDLIRAIQNERRAEAEQWHLAREVTRQRAKRRTRNRTVHRPSRPGIGWARRDLAGWLSTTGELIASLDRSQLRERRGALAVAVDELLAAARDGGVRVTVAADASDDPVVAARTLAWLAGHTAGTPIEVSRHRRRRLASAIGRLTGDHGHEAPVPGTGPLSSVA